ncbi:MAG: Gfo/Idh/MocA family oxidoreductase, partial [Bdellovibrionales bacterium]|nr:Gfo/Idh/MocA family oxidoreductase [Bdellovibrionales bacterium]
MIRLGIIGTGNIASSGHAQALLSSRKAQLWSVLSRDLGRAKDFARTYKAQSLTPAFDSFKEFLSDPDLDGVIVTSPDNLHFEHGMLVAKHKKPMLMEKPFVTNFEQGSELLQYCKSNQVTLAIGYHLRWHRGHQTMLRAIRAGEIGKVLLVRVLWTWKAADASNWRAQADLGKWWSLAGVGTHCLDLARWIIGEDENAVTSIQGQTSSPIFGSKHDELATLQLKTK